MADFLRDNPVSRFAKGFLYPFLSARFIGKNPSLWKYVLVPFLVNLLIFSLAVYFGLDFFNDFVVRQIPQGEAWYWGLVYYFLWLVALAVTAVLVFFCFTVVGNLISSPFNDLLSERTEELLSGTRNEERFSLGLFWKDSLRTLGTEAKKMSLFVIVMLLILPLNLIPGFGNALYSLLALLLTLFFLAFEYLGYVMARKRLSFREQRRYVLGRTPLMLGFGTGVLAILAIPFLQFICIPAGVVGATRLWFDLSGTEAMEKDERPGTD